MSETQWNFTQLKIISHFPFAFYYYDCYESKMWLEQPAGKTHCLHFLRFSSHSVSVADRDGPLAVAIHRFVRMCRMKAWNIVRFICECLGIHRRAKCSSFAMRTQATYESEHASFVCNWYYLILMDYSNSWVKRATTILHDSRVLWYRSKKKKKKSRYKNNSESCLLLLLSQACCNFCFWDSHVLWRCSGVARPRTSLEHSLTHQSTHPIRCANAMPEFISISFHSILFFFFIFTSLSLALTRNTTRKERKCFLFEKPIQYVCIMQLTAVFRAAGVTFLPYAVNRSASRTHARDYFDSLLLLHPCCAVCTHFRLFFVQFCHLNWLFCRPIGRPIRRAIAHRMVKLARARDRGTRACEQLSMRKKNGKRKLNELKWMRSQGDRLRLRLRPASAVVLIT